MMREIKVVARGTPNGMPYMSQAQPPSLVSETPKHQRDTGGKSWLRQVVKSKAEATSSIQIMIDRFYSR